MRREATSYRFLLCRNTFDRVENYTLRDTPFEYLWNTSIKQRIIIYACSVNILNLIRWPFRVRWHYHLQQKFPSVRPVFENSKLKCIVHNLSFKYVCLMIQFNYTIWSIISFVLVETYLSIFVFIVCSHPNTN